MPTGYSFNLDGVDHMTMAAMFIAQASNVDLSIGQQLGMLAVLLLTSKGRRGGHRRRLRHLAATLAVFPTIPSPAWLLVGIDRFMSKSAR